MQLFTPIEYLKIDIANNFSKELDYSNFNTRIDWFNSNEKNLSSLVQEANNPALFYAGLQAYKAYLKNEPIGYPICLDATASGIQLLTCLMNCEISAINSGLIGEHRIDIYSFLYTQMEGDQYTRDEVKAAIMTSFYSSKREPEKLFGKNTPELEKFYKVLSDNLPGPFILNKSLETLWNKNALEHCWELPDNFQVKIKVTEEKTFTFNFMGETFFIDKKVNKPSNNYRSISANIVHSIDSFIVREVNRRCNYNIETILYVYDLLGSDKAILSSEPRRTKGKDIMVERLWNHYLETNILSLRIIDYLDKENINIITDLKILEELVTSIPMLPFEVLYIHDAFKVHPNYGNDIRKQYNKLLFEICNSNILQHIARKITNNDKLTFDTGEANISKKVLESNYALS